jgi:hypothetical protein
MVAYEDIRMCRACFDAVDVRSALQAGDPVSPGAAQVLPKPRPSTVRRVRELWKRRPWLCVAAGGVALVLLGMIVGWVLAVAFRR